ncbi:MAG: HlyD family secretion protein [Gammaproteobacteria bacterium]|nr:MAG: HlyD family secretion protein [Gammaproteobacteria bacterium]
MSILCSLPLIASLFGNCSPRPFATGYVEGEYVIVAPVEIAQVRKLSVSRGDKVPAGTVLVEMERRDAEIALAQADARLAQARSQHADLLEGARPAEIQVIEANLTSALLQAEEANRTLERIRQLATRGATTDAQLDDATTAARVAEARVAQIRAELDVARLPARPQAIDRSKAAVAAAQAARERADWRLEQRSLSLSTPVTVVDIIRTDGEIAGPSAPVLSVLPEAAVKLLLYVPERQFSSISVGDALQVGCDGCDDGLVARISYISDTPEFTPPVIYSLENRQKLVYLVEARPEASHTLRPGQIVSVTLPEAENGE